MGNQQDPSLLAAKRLILVCRDCESVLTTAAEVAESGVTRRRYRERAAAWMRLRTALEGAVLKRGGRPRRESGVTEILQRAWIKIQSGLGDPSAIAAECQRREAKALRRCALAAEEDLPMEVRDLVARFCQHARTPVYNQR